jgi:hypothetical protein
VNRAGFHEEWPTSPDFSTISSPKQMNLNPAVGFYEKSGSHRWAQINTDFLKNRHSPVG